MRSIISQPYNSPKLLIRRKGPPGVPPELERMAILRGLLELGRRGKIDGVWYEDHSKRLSIKRTPYSEIARLSWEDAAAMILAESERKPPQSVTAERFTTRASSGQ